MTIRDFLEYLALTLLLLAPVFVPFVEELLWPM